MKNKLKHKSINPTKPFFALFILILFQFFIIGESKAQTKIPNKNLLVVFYNVENLFDTIDDPRKNDNEFLPTSKKKWGAEYYNTKLKNLSFVFSSIDKKKLPDLIGMAEVENDAVLEDLIKTGKLNKGKYKIIHFESPDMRSIDVALLIKNKQFRVLYSHPILVSIPNETNFKTRDILYVKLLHFNSKDTLHIFVNHWPSRLGGEEKSAFKRIAAAKTLKKYTDSIFANTSNPKIIIMGDMNDEPNNTSLNKVLNALPSDTVFSENQLFNLCYPLFRQNEGSYYYHREKKWNMIDNMVVSSQLIKSSLGILSISNTIFIYKPDWILYTDNQGIKSPSKTYGAKYFGGYSDHLPIYQYFIY